VLIKKSPGVFVPSLSEIALEPNVHSAACKQFISGIGGSVSFADVDRQFRCGYWPGSGLPAIPVQSAGRGEIQLALGTLGFVRDCLLDLGGVLLPNLRLAGRLAGEFTALVAFPDLCPGCG